MVAFSQNGYKVFPVPHVYPIFEHENSVLSFDGKKIREPVCNALAWGAFLI